MTWMRWPNVGLWLVDWLMVGFGFVTLGQRRGRRATLHWANADCKRWPNVAADAGLTLDQCIHLGKWPNVGPMSKSTLVQGLFMKLGQHARTTMGKRWPNIAMLSGFIFQTISGARSTGLAFCLL